MEKALTQLNKWIDRNLGWFFKNGNKITKMNKKEDNNDLGVYHYRLTENENETVTIEMPKRVFTTFMKITKFGNDCINFNTLPTRIPGKTKGTASAINGLSYDAFKMGREMYEERIKNKLESDE